MHKHIALGICTLVVIGGLLTLGSSTSDAANKGNMATYGWVYGVPSVDAWQKSLPAGREGPDKFDRENMQVTHFVFESSSDAARNNLNQQKALHRALGEGWQMVAMDNGRMLIFHPKRTVWDHDRK